MKQGSLQVRSGQVGREFDLAVKRGVSVKLITQVMTRHPEVFSNKTDLKKLIGNRLGWVDIASSMKRKVTGIETFGQKALKDGIKHVVLMGMGGSSLCPELFKLFHGKHSKLKSFDVIDSTDPDAVNAVARKIDLKHSLFLVASKSGGTVETRSQETHFIGRLQNAGIRKFGRHFVAITDKGSKLESFARKNKYRKIFINPSDIGGRYSALSFFGLVPAFFAGVDLRALLDESIIMEEILRQREDETNPALILGALTAVSAKAGLDKLTFLSSKKCAPLVPWVEQLVAESTGKKGKGIIPIDAEPSGTIARYGKDRVFVTLKMAGEEDPISQKLRGDIIKKKYPLIEMTLGSRAELGRQFLLWEAATAAMGFFLGVNPFDEPNVTESKDNTNKILAKFEKIGTMSNREAPAQWGKLNLVAIEDTKRYTRPQQADLKKLLKRFLSGHKNPRYFSLLSYFKSDKKTELALETSRTIVRDKTKLATLRGYGPRYLHSIGQLYKGGPQNGLFVVFVRSRYGKADIPGQPFDFGTLISAQADGDAQALINRKIPTLVIAIDGKPSEGLDYFAKELRKALS